MRLPTVRRRRFRYSTKTYRYLSGSRPGSFGFGFSRVGRECSSEHGPLADRLFFGRFILNYVPMLDKDSVLNAHDICGNPIHGSTETAKSPVHDYHVSLSHDHSRLVLQRWRNALDEIEQTLTPGCYMSAVLNIVGRPETLSGCIVTLVEQRVEGFQDKSFISRFDRFTHLSFPPIRWQRWILTASIHRRLGYSRP